MLKVVRGGVELVKFLKKKQINTIPESEKSTAKELREIERVKQIQKTEKRKRSEEEQRELIQQRQGTGMWKKKREKAMIQRKSKAGNVRRGNTQERRE